MLYLATALVGAKLVASPFFCVRATPDLALRSAIVLYIENSRNKDFSWLELENSIYRLAKSLLVKTMNNQMADSILNKFHY